MKPGFGRRDMTQPVAPNPFVLPAVADPAVLETRDLRERVLKEIDPRQAALLTPQVLHREIERVIHQIANEDRLGLSGREQSRLAEELVQDMTGLGPLEPLLADDSITDIMVNGPDAIYVERRGQLERVDVRFRDATHIMVVAQKIAARIGRRIDESSPMVDARLVDGSRINAIVPPLAIDSPCISIRKFPKRRLDLQAMVDNGTMTAGIARLLGIAAAARLNILISGGTGSGKTTLLNAMSQLISPKERIISIEDAAELQLQQPHVIRLETRPPSLEGGGQVTQNDLLRNALRMRPDRIILGEVRGAEAFDMLQAMNTGHDGSISTIHANSTRDALVRVENMVLMGHFNLPVRAIRSQIVGALDLIIQIERMRDGVRRIVQVSEVCGLEGDIITTNDHATFEYQQEDANGGIAGRYDSARIRPGFMPRLELYGQDRAWLAAMREV
ncbi:CpaF family protein [Rhodopila globiformis]|uniref:Pilus assembly protein CpaF n=1 Tax=Rhodopila globiformis TaxID=1071 RepID=A0A2S6MW17_RHOGL|nr:CpaF family protein [Rhodopila globiformis]PPQ26560.1 pilus assembly protein CpaF [Rhodopila globiformis]